MRVFSKCPENVFEQEQPKSFACQLFVFHLKGRWPNIEYTHPSPSNDENKNFFFLLSVKKFFFLQILFGTFFFKTSYTRKESFFHSTSKMSYTKSFHRARK